MTFIFIFCAALCFLPDRVRASRGSWMNLVRWMEEASLKKQKVCARLDTTYTRGSRREASESSDFYIYTVDMLFPVLIFCRCLVFTLNWLPQDCKKWIKRESNGRASDLSERATCLSLVELIWVQLVVNIRFWTDISIRFESNSVSKFESNCQSIDIFLSGIWYYTRHHSHLLSKLLHPVAPSQFKSN